MVLIPIPLRTANAFVEQHNRHHGRVAGCKFCLGVRDEGGVLRGVAIVGRPLSRYLDDGFTAEVNRLCTDGLKNACSFLYSACARVAKEMGYHKILTYILESEDGASLKASGWSYTGICGGGSWNTPGRPRRENGHQEKKKRYEKMLGKGERHGIQIP